MHGTAEPATESATGGRVSEANQLLIGLALLVGAAVSVTLAVLQWSVPGKLHELIGNNALGLRGRRSMLAILFGFGGLAALAVGAFRLLKRPTNAVILRWGKLLSPFLVAAFVPALFTREPWKNLELEYLIVLGVAGVLFERLLTLSFAELRLPDVLRVPDTPRARALLCWIPFALVCAGVLYYAVLIGHYTLVSHVRMATSTADLGEYDNQFFNSLHGHPFRLPASEGDLRNWTALKFHADFIIYVLLPFYALKPGPEVLLLLQTSLIALTAVPIYLFGARRLPGWLAAIVALAYLLMPAVERPNFYDFHAVPIGMFFVAWAIYAVDRILHTERPRRRDYVLLWSAFVLALASREDIAFGMLIVSLFLLFYGRAPRLAAGMLLASSAYFVLIKFVIMPRFGVSWYDGVYEDIKAPGLRGYGAVVVSMLTNPVFVLRSMLSTPKLLYLLHMSVPLLFLWLRRPYLWVAALPSLFFTLMVTNRPPMFQSSFQYAYQWFPYIVVASILALEGLRSSSLGPQRQAAAGLALALVAAGAGYQYGVLLGGKSILGGFGEKLLRASRDEETRYHQLHALAARIPEQASVAATEQEGPHVSTRLVLYNIRYGMGDKPDYLLFNRALGSVEAERVIQALRSGDYGVLEQRGPFVLVRRGHSTKNNARLLAQLERH